MTTIILCGIYIAVGLKVERNAKGGRHKLLALAQSSYVRCVVVRDKRYNYIGGEIEFSLR